MKIYVNGDLCDCREAETIDVLVAALADSPRGVAVAVNGEVVPRSEWHETALHVHDRVEVLGTAQGG